MDLFDLMSQGREDKALDRLETMLAGYESGDEAEPGLALERAMNFCDLEWGSYAAGLEALAQRIESRSKDPVEAAMRALRLREEGDEPGAIIRAIRLDRRRAQGRLDEREQVVAHYGGEAAALAPTDWELIFISATAHLAEPGEDACVDAQAPLAGWHLPWHDLPEALSEAVSRAHPLPQTVAAARDECQRWDQRLRHLEILYGTSAGDGVLPTACAARRKLVEDLWRRGIAARTLADFSARLDYWAGRGGDDGTGYGLLQADLAAVSADWGRGAPKESTKERARRLKAENPDWSLARIGKALGISRQAVHKHLKGAAPA